MKKVLLKCYLLFFFAAISMASFAQSFDSVLKKLDKEYPQEKLYLQFDKPVYNAGETIWFKAYLFSGVDPSLISKNIYTELLDANGKIIQRKVSPIILSGAASSFDLPADLKTSVVYVRAYTKWMLNFDSSFLFTKAIPIVTPVVQGKSSSGTTSKTASANNPSRPVFFLQFFPEGGDLVQGIESRVAFKATDRTGMPAQVSGNIVNSKGSKIVSFSAMHDGMGRFMLQPQNNEQYKAVWTDAMGYNHETPLPAAKQSGVALEVNDVANQIEFKIKRQANTSPYPFIYVVAQMDQHLLYRAKATLTKAETVSGYINIENMPAGIVQLTLFTPDEKPLAERIVFINQSEASFITDLNAAVKNVDKRKKNTIEIDVPDTLACNLSVAVTDADLNPGNAEDNIYSHVLLTSDIKGYVHDPAYYFSSDADSVADHLDLVMMTNGWRRFNWDNVLAGHFPKINYLPENYLSIEGRVYGISKSLIANKDVNGILQLKNGNTRFVNLPIQPDGKFILSSLIFFDTAKFYYQINQDKRLALTERANFDVKSNLLKDALHLSPDSNSVLDVIKPDAAFLARNKEVYEEEMDLSQLQNVKTLKEVVVTARKKTKQEIMDEQYTSGFFSSGDARFFSPDDPAFSTSLNVLQYLQGRVAGLQINLTGSPVSLTWRGSPVSLFLNEMQADADMIENLPMTDVAMVKVFSPPFFGAMGGGGGGAIAVYLKKGITADQASIKGLEFVSIAGYSPVKEFYSPDYSKTDSLYAPDYRTTLYWNPFVLTDKEHRRLFLSFYNNDITKKIRVIIEGCNEEGKLTRVEKVFQ